MRKGKFVIIEMPDGVTQRYKWEEIEKIEKEVLPPSRESNKLGISLGFLGQSAGVYTLSVDYYIKPILALEIGGSWGTTIITSHVNRSSTLPTTTLYFGPKWAILGNNSSQRWSPYIGAYILSHWLTVNREEARVSAKSIFYSDTKQRLGAYFPFGIELIAHNGFTFAVEFGVLTIESAESKITLSNGYVKTRKIYGGILPWGSIKVGYHF